ncbi:CsbD family protein [Tessaracoccus coleopterorum]|uniref:CsbD family protein n=1 Tax=Tessaracoccus coleopterorum TaxID=2714950 RepID=UPI0022B24E12|nr:CsbD family protein [Tessaracoccus coleopterorum]
MERVPLRRDERYDEIDHRHPTVAIMFGRPEGGYVPVTNPQRGGIMGIDDKIGNAAQEAAGKLKEGVGKATDNERLEAEGRADQAKADVKQAGEKIKDVFK